MKFLRLVSLVSCSCLFYINNLVAVYEWQGFDNKGQSIILAHYRADEVSPNLLEQMKMVFVQSFSEAYKDIPLEVLGIENLQDLLHRAFQEEEDAVKFLKQPDYFVVTVSYANRLVGFVCFNAEGNHAYYVRELAVSPCCQRNGLGEQLIMACKKHDEQVAAVRLVTRRVNTQARSFYVNKLGFVESSYQHQGLDPKKYVGYEKIIKTVEN